MGKAWKHEEGINAIGTKRRKTPQPIFWTSLFWVLTSRFWLLCRSAVANMLNLNAHPNTCIHVQIFGAQLLSLLLGASLFSNHSACFKLQLLPCRCTLIASQWDKLVLPVQKHVFSGAFLSALFSCLLFVGSHQISPCISAWVWKGFLTPAVSSPALWSKTSKAVALTVPAFLLSAVSWVLTLLSKLVIHTKMLSYVGRVTEQ